MDIYENLRKIDFVKLNFDENSSVYLNITIAFIMLGVALELNFDDFKKLLTNPKPAFVGILSQFILLPFFTFLVVLGLQEYITPAVGLGMILVASCPGGNISNFISNLAKGNLALSVSLTTFSSIGSLLLTPLNFTFWGNLFLHFYSRSEGYDLVRNLEIDAVSVIKTLLLILALPIFSGMILKSKFPRTIARMVPTIKKLSILIFAAIVIIIFTSNYDFFIKYIFYIFFIVLFHNILAMATGYYSGRLFGLDKKNCKTVSIETGIQNSGLALALLFNPDVFPQDLPLGGMTFIAAWWGVWHIIAGLTIALLWSGFLFRPQKIR